MNKQVMLCMLALGASAPLIANSSCCVTNNEGICSSCECKAVSKTFFSVNPVFQGVSPERNTFMREAMWAKEDGHHGAFQFAVFGGQSKDTARYGAYFGPSCGNQWFVAENDSITPFAPDVLSDYFNVRTVNGTFQSKITFNPQQSVFGFGLHYKQSLARDENEKGCFFEISMPIVRISNTMGFVETIIDDGGGAITDAVGSMTEAFVQPAWNYGRITASGNCTNEHESCSSNCDNSYTTCNMQKWGVADIDIRLGHEYVRNEKVQANSFIGILAPTSNTPKAVNVFEPITGHNGHVGLSFGSYAGVEVWSNEACDRRIVGSIDLFGLYLFQRNERRLLDVKNKPWSRYMWVYANKAQAQQAVTQEDDLLATPGVNVFAQDLCVSPGFQATANSSFTYYAPHFNAEIGCNFFAREAECVKLACCWKEGPAFKALNPGDPRDPAGTYGTTNNIETIASNFAPVVADTTLANYDTNLIKEDDLDLLSATHPGLMTFDIYGAMGYRWDDCDNPRFVGIGGSWEFAEDNLGLNRWLLWAKAGVSF